MVRLLLLLLPPPRPKAPEFVGLVMTLECACTKVAAGGFRMKLMRIGCIGVSERRILEEAPRGAPRGNVL
jgi:hypothetical protein